MYRHAVLQEREEQRKASRKTASTTCPHIQQPFLHLQIKPTILGRAQVPLSFPVNLRNLAP